MQPIMLIRTVGTMHKFYRMIPTPDGVFIAHYGRLGSPGVRHTYLLSKWDDIYDLRIRHGYAPVDAAMAFNALQTALCPKCDGPLVDLRNETAENWIVNQGASDDCVVCPTCGFKMDDDDPLAAMVKAAEEIAK